MIEHFQQLQDNKRDPNWFIIKWKSQISINNHGNETILKIQTHRQTLLV